MSKFIKKCRSCGDLYDTRDKPITITLNHKDIEAIEDAFFCENSEEEYKRIKPKLLKIWVQLCKEEDKWKKPSKSLLDYAGIWADMPETAWKEFEKGVQDARKGINKGFKKRIAKLRL